MRKIIVSILAVFYLCSSTGATVHMHYCMGKLVNWSLIDKGDKCSKCGMEKDGGCCKDENKFVKNNFDQKATESTVNLFLSFANAIPAFIENPGTYSSSLIERCPISHAPPIDSGIDILIRNCVFRI